MSHPVQTVKTKDVVFDEAIYPRSAWEAAQGKQLCALLGQPGAREWFERNGTQFLPEFAAEIDRLMGSNDAARTSGCS